MAQTAKRTMRRMYKKRRSACRGTLVKRRSAKRCKTNKSGKRSSRRRRR